MSLILENGLILNQPTGGGGSGDITGAANIGDGENVFSSKVGSSLQFRTLKGGGDVNVTVSGNELRLSANSGLQESEGTALNLSWPLNSANIYGTEFAGVILSYDDTSNPPLINLGDLNGSNQLQLNGVSNITNFLGTISFNVNGANVLSLPQVVNSVSGMALIASDTGGNTEWREILTKAQIEAQYNKRQGIVNVSTATAVSAGLRNNVIFVSGAVQLTIQDSGWSAGDCFSIISTVSAVTVVPGAGITLSYSGSAATATIDKPFEGISFVARTPTQFYAIGKLG